MSQVKPKDFKSSDGHVVHCDLYAHGRDRLLIVAPGFFNSKQALLMKELGQKLGPQFDAMVLDFRGHGQSRGRFYWTSKEYLDLMPLFDFGRANYRRVGLIGFSLGAATSLIAASKSDKVDALVAVSPPAEFGKIEYHFWQLDVALDVHYSLLAKGRIGKGVNPGPFWLAKEKPRDIVRGLRLPVFYIHGTEDWLIKPWHSQLLYEQTASTIKKLDIMAGAPHAEYMIKTHGDDFIGRIKGWFKQTL